jgi:hypothetical protein
VRCLGSAQNFIRLVVSEIPQMSLPLFKDAQCLSRRHFILKSQLRNAGDEIISFFLFGKRLWEGYPKHVTSYLCYESTPFPRLILIFNFACNVQVDVYVSPQLGRRRPRCLWHSEWPRIVTKRQLHKIFYQMPDFQSAHQRRRLARRYYSQMANIIFSLGADKCLSLIAQHNVMKSKYVLTGH